MTDARPIYSPVAPVEAAPAIATHLDALERALVARSFPAMSAWWRATFERFYRAGRRQLVIRAGRRAGKSSSLCRIAVLEALFGGHVVPPGDVGVVAIVSVSRDEGAQRLRTIRAILDALGIAHRPIDNGIELADRPVVFKVYAASIAGVSGFTTIAIICDEVAKWRDADTGSNPAKEVLASLRPTMATQRSARIFLSSSPLGMLDAHAEAFDAGDTAFQSTAHAATWIANPTITEEETHALEPEDRIWRREYAAIPQAGTLSAFDSEAIARAFVARPFTDAREPMMIIDASSGRKDTWSWAIVRAAKCDGRDVVVFDRVDGVRGSFWKTLSGADIVARVAGVAKEAGAHVVHADQREALMLASEFEKHGLTFTVHDWTSVSKPAAVERARRWFADSALILCEHDGMRRELLSFEERITASGSFTFGARGSGHDDFVALLITAAMADLAGDLTARTPYQTLIVNWSTR